MDEVYFGIYRGIVVDPHDPQGKHRLLVKVPSINGDGELGWAMPCFPLLTRQPQLIGSAGEHALAGATEPITIRVPKRGDAVWVMFEAGDVDAPVWVGTWTGV